MVTGADPRPDAAPVPGTPCRRLALGWMAAGLSAALLPGWGPAVAGQPGDGAGFTPLPGGAGFTPQGGFDKAAFDIWMSMRAGDGAPVFWYSEGTLRDFPSGRLIALMEGFDTARSHWPEPGGAVAHQYNRKIYLFRDPATGAVLEQMNGRAIDTIAYPYQFIRYALKGDRVETMVEQGAGARLQRFGPDSMMAHRRIGSTRVFTAPVFLDIPLPNGRMQAFENYDFAVNPAQPPADWVLSWVRTGAAPAWAGTQQAVMHLVTRRFERFDAMPEPMRRHVLAKAPLWQAPPESLDDIRRLQQA